MNGPGRIVLLDLQTWDALDQWGAALHHKGLRIVRVVEGPRRLRRLKSALDRWRFGAAPVEVPGLTGIWKVHPWLAPPTLDIQGPETEMKALEDSLSNDSSGRDLMRRVGPTINDDVLYDKWLITGLAHLHGLTVPDSWLEPPADVFPLVVKGRISAGGQDVSVVDRREALTSVTQSMRERPNGGLFFQRALRGCVLNAGGVADRGTLLVHAVYTAQADPEDPLGPPRLLTIADRPDIVAQMAGLVKALGYTGVFCIDYVDDDAGKPALIDFNPRVFGGWLQLQLAGIDFLGAYLHLLHQGPPPVNRALLPGSTLDVNILPATATSWRELREGTKTSLSTIREAAVVTGWRFGSMKFARSALAAARQSANLLRR